jgi:hypothetical protein
MNMPRLAFRHLMTLGLAAATLCIAPVASAGPKIPTTSLPKTPTVDKSADKIVWVRRATVLGIDTDKTGTILTVAYSDSSGSNTANGCGAKIANVPHLVAALKGKNKVNLRINNGCIDRYGVSRS